MSTNTNKRKATSPSRSDTVKKIKHDKPWTKGDLTLISVDDVSFKVDSLQLKAASSFFRDAGGMNLDTPMIHFSDETETAQVIRTFLQLTHEGIVRYPFRTSKWRRDTVFICETIQFCNKYGCDAALGHFLDASSFRWCPPMCLATA